MKRNISNNRIKTADLISFTRQFATLYKSGVSILSALNNLQMHTSNPTLAKTLSFIKEDITTGSTLSQAMAKYPKIFNKLYVNIVQVGETTGYLGQTMMKLAFMLDREERLKRDLNLVLYPPLIPIVIFLIAPGLLVFIRILISSMPVLDKISFFLIFLIRRYWLVGIIFLIFYSFAQSKIGRMRWNEMKFKIPFIGPVIIRKMTVLRFARIFEILHKANLPILENLSVISRSFENPFISYQIDAIAFGFTKGQGLVGGMRETDIFLPLEIEVIAMGEKTGKLDEAMDQLANQFDWEVERAIKKLAFFSDKITIILFIFLAIYLIFFFAR